jgi:hypothetical protein
LKVATEFGIVETRKSWYAKHCDLQAIHSRWYNPPDDPFLYTMIMSETLVLDKLQSNLHDFRYHDGLKASQGEKDFEDTLVEAVFWSIAFDLDEKGRQNHQGQVRWRMVNFHRRSGFFLLKACSVLTC